MSAAKGRSALISTVALSLSILDVKINTEAARRATATYLNIMADRGEFGVIGWYWSNATDPARLKVYRAIARQARRLRLSRAASSVPPEA
jgi:hypothetical protein